MVSSPAILKLALANLWVNKLRSFLTVLSMTFGTGAVIATLSSSEGAKRYLTDQLQSLGSNVVTVTAATDRGVNVGEDGRRLVRRYSTVFDGITLVDAVPARVLRAGGRATVVPIFAVEPEYFPTLRLVPLRGRVFDRTEDLQEDLRVVIGAGVKKALFGAGPAVGQFVDLDMAGFSLPLEVIGVMREKGGASGAKVDEAVFLPLRLGRQLFAAKDRTRSMLATLKSDEASDVGRRQLRALLKPFYKRLAVSDAREAIERTRAVWQKQNLVGLSLALVSLVTGGIGIMNIMLISVHQRRKEIGLRKAVGASSFNVCLQFLLEAAVVCLLGGAVGTVAGWLFGKQVASMLGQWEAVTSLQTVLTALGFSVFTGIFFGLFPAVRASRLDPYDALRIA